MEFWYFLFAFIILVYCWRISGRVKRLEKSLLQKTQPTHPAPAPMPELHTDILSTHPLSAQAVQHQESQITRPQTIFSFNISEITTNQWLAIIGSIALLFGIGFFLKYAFDQGWLPPILKVFIGIAVGLLLVVLGEIWKEKFAKNARILTGGGLAIVYASVVGWYQFYGLPQHAAFIILLVCMAGGVALAYRYGSKVLASVSLIGAYLAPLVLNSGHNQQIALFAYLTLVNVGVLCMLFRKFWVELLYVLLAGFGLNFVLWAVTYSSLENTVQSVLFVMGNYMLLVLVANVLFHYHHEHKNVPVESETFLGLWHAILGVGVLAALGVLLQDPYRAYLGLSSLSCGVICFLAYAFVDRLEYKKLNYCVSLVASLFVCAAVWWQFDGFVRDWYLLLLVIIGIAAGFGLKRSEIRTWAWALLVFSTVLVLGESYPEQSQFLLNQKFSLELLCCILFAVISWAYSRMQVLPEERKAISLSQGIGLFLLLIVVSWEGGVNFKIAHYNFGGSLFVSYWWLIYALVVAYCGRRHGRVFTVLPFFLLLLTLIKILGDDYGVHPVFLFNPRFISALLASGGVLLYSRFVRPLEVEKTNGITLAQLSQSVTAGYLWLVVSAEIVHNFASVDSGNARNLLLSIWWMGYAVVLVFVSHAAKNHWLRKGAVVLFGLTILKVFLYDVQALDQGYRIVSFILLGIILLSVSFAFQKNKDRVKSFWEGDTPHN